MLTELNFYRQLPIYNFHHAWWTVNDALLLAIFHDMMCQILLNIYLIAHDVIESCTNKTVHTVYFAILRIYQFRKQFVSANLLFKSPHSNEKKFKESDIFILRSMILKVVGLRANLWLLRMLCLWFQSIWRSVQQGAKMIKAAIKIFTETSSTFMWTYQSQKKTSPVSLSSKAKQKNHHNITRLRYCLSPLSPTNLFQIQILFLSAGVNTAGTVGDIYFSIHDDIRPFHLPLQFQNN